MENRPACILYNVDLRLIITVILGAQAIIIVEPLRNDGGLFDGKCLIVSVIILLYYMILTHQY